MAKKSLAQRLEKTHLVLKFVLIGGSAYLMWRQWHKTKLEEEAAIALRAQAEAAVKTGPSGATKPLVEQVATLLPTVADKVLTYGGMSPDQSATAQALPTVQQQLLTSASGAGAAYLNSILR